MLLVLACDNNKPDPGDDPLGLSYFPLQEGMFWIYEVERQDYHIDGSISTTECQLKYIAEQEDLGFTIAVYQKLPGDNWEEYATYQASRTDKIAVVNEGATSFIKLSFPLEDGRSWNGNALNAQGEDLYEMDSLGEAFSFRDYHFENTVTVIQEYQIDPIQITSDKIALEVYAKGVGRVYEEVKELEYKSCSSLYPECCAENSTEKCFGEIDEGFITYQYLIDYGVE